MSWANIQSTGTFNATAGTTLALAYGSNVTAGNRLIAVCIWSGGGTEVMTCAVTDSQGNTWAGVAGSLATALSPSSRIQIFHAQASAAAADTATMTVSGTAAERVIMLGEFSGLSGSLGASPLSATGTASNPTANITLDATTSLIVGGLFTAGTGAAGSGYTLLSSQDGNIGEYRLPGGPGAQPVSFTEAGSALYAISGVEFLASPTVTPPPPDGIYRYSRIRSPRF